MVPQKYKHTDTIRIGDTIIFICATVMAIISAAAAIYVTGTLVDMYIPPFLSYDLLWGKLSIGLSVLGIAFWTMFCLFVLIAVYYRNEIKNSKQQNRWHPSTGEAYDFCLRKALDDMAKKMKRPGQ